MRFRAIISKVAAVLLFVFTALSSAAQDCRKSSLGLYNSFKGFGINYTSPTSEKTFTSVGITADCYGIFSGGAKRPGYIASFERDYIFTNRPASDGVDCQFYAGAGFFGGYSRDYEPGFLEPKHVMQKNPGIVAGVQACIGARLVYSDRIEIRGSLTIDGGMHWRDNEKRPGHSLMSFYWNGVARCLYPEVLILWRIGR